jgi:hypothetical protein
MKKDVETRVHEKIMEHGVNALFHFVADEFAYYTKYVEPVILLQVRANVGLSTKYVN